MQKARDKNVDGANPVGRQTKLRTDGHGDPSSKKRKRRREKTHRTSKDRSIRVKNKQRHQRGTNRKIRGSSGMGGARRRHNSHGL